MSLLIGTGIVFLQDGTQSQTEAPKEVESKEEPTKSKPPSVIQTLADVEPVEDIVAYADQHMVAGNFGVAIRSYLRCIKSKKKGLVMDPHLLLRIAFSQELIGELKSAKAAYLEILSVATNLKHLRIATCGLARVESELGNQYESISQLSPLLLSQTVDKKSMSMEMTRYQWATALHRRAAGSLESSTDSINPINQRIPMSESASLTPPWNFKRPSPGQMLTWIDEANTVDERKAEATQEPIQVLQRPTNSTATIGLKLRVSGTAYSKLIKQLESGTQLEFRISEAAANKFAGRSVNLHIDSTMLSLLLDHLFIPLGLVWQQDSTQILIADSSELLSEETRSEFYYDAAERALKDFEIRHSDSDFVLESIMSRATMSMRRGDFDQAANLFREVQRARPQGEMLANLFYYLGTINLYFDRRKEGIDYLYRAVDQTRNRDLASSSYCILSRVHLTAKELELSIRCGRRAFNLAEQDWQHRSASANLARAYLLNGDPYSANQFIFKGGPFFRTDSGEKSVVALLGAYSRLDSKQLPDSKRSARVRLLTAVTMTKPSELLSFADCYIAAKSFQALGFPERSLGLLSLSLTRSDIGDWRRSITFETAQLEETLNLADQALIRYQGLLDQADQFKRKALSRIAAIHLDAGAFDKSIATCKLLLDDAGTNEEKREALAVLGTAYRGKGDHKSAALCFAGYDPERLSVN